MREVLAGIINRIPSPLDTTTLEFTAGPSAWSYEGSTKPELCHESDVSANRTPKPCLYRQACRLVACGDCSEVRFA